MDSTTTVTLLHIHQYGLSTTGCGQSLKS